MNKVNHFCGNCPYFLHEDALGAGFCQVRDRAARCGDRCSLRYDTLTDRQIIRLLREHLLTVLHMGHYHTDRQIAERVLEELTA